MGILGATIGNKHTFRDFKMFSVSKLVFDPPSVKTNYTNIPEADGSIDQTEVLTGEVHYTNRQARWEFNVIEHRKRWDSLFSEIMNFLHGKKMKIILDSDKGWYYIGRLSVNKWQSNKKVGTIVIDIDAEPYKYRMIESTDPWLWDPFCFPTDYVMGYSNIEISGTKEIKIINSRQTVVPVITVSDVTIIDLTVKFEGHTYDLTEGTNVIPEIRLKQGENKLIFTTSDTAKVSIKYREGSL